MNTSDSEAQAIHTRPIALGLAAVSACALLPALALLPLSTRRGILWFLLIVGSLALAAALASWRLPGVRRAAKRVADAAAKRLDVSAARLPLVAAGLLFALAARAAAGDGPQAISPLAVPLWIFGVVLIVLGLRAEGRRWSGDRWPTWEVLFLAGLFIGGLLLRAWGADHMPYVLGGDEGSAGSVAWEFVTGERDNLLGLGWFSFPALYFWLLSLGQAVFGRTTEAIRWVSGLAGALTLPALYWAARPIYGRRVAALAALWLAAFHHHIFFSRLAYNNIWDGLFFILSAGALWRAWQANDRRYFLLTGLILGLAQFFYTTGHLTPLLMLLWMAWLHGRSRPDESRWPGVLAMGLAAAAVVLPLALLYLSRPQMLLFTSSRVSMLVPGWTSQVAAALGTSATGLVLEQIWVTALGLTAAELQGVYYGSGVPLLFGISAWLFAAGSLLCIANVRRARGGLPLLTLAATLIVGGLSIQAPNGQRMLLLPPILAILVAWPLDSAARWLAARWPGRTFAVNTLLTLIILAAAAQNLTHLFGAYFPNEDYGSLNGEVTQAMVDILRREKEPFEAYFIGGERMSWNSIPSITYLLPDLEMTNLAPPYDLPASGPGMKTLIFILPEQLHALDLLRGRYPHAEVRSGYNRHGRFLFYLLTIAQP